MTSECGVHKSHGVWWAMQGAGGCDANRALRLRALSLDSLWVLMETPQRQPQTTHDQAFYCLSRLAIAQRRGLLSRGAKDWLKQAVLQGLARHVDTLLTAVGAPDDEEVDDVAEDGLEADPLIADFGCPIAHEIMLGGSLA